MPTHFATVNHMAWFILATLPPLDMRVYLWELAPDGAPARAGTSVVPAPDPSPAAESAAVMGEPAPVIEIDEGADQAESKEVTKPTSIFDDPFDDPFGDAGSSSTSSSSSSSAATTAGAADAVGASGLAAAPTAVVLTDESAVGFGDSGDAGLEKWVRTDTPLGHRREVYDVAWAPDGTGLISGGFDNFAIVWASASAAALSLQGESQGKAALGTAPSSPPSASAISGSDGGAASGGGAQLTAAGMPLWPAFPPRTVPWVLSEMLPLHGDLVQGVAWDPLSHLLITQSADTTARVYAMGAVPADAALCVRARKEVRGTRVKALLDARRRFDPHAVSSSASASASAAPPAAAGTAATAAGAAAAPVAGSAMTDEADSAAASAAASSAAASSAAASSPASSRASTGPSIPSHPLFVREELSTFFRRPAFSPCGTLLAFPAGQYAELPAASPASSSSSSSSSSALSSSSSLTAEAGAGATTSASSVSAVLRNAQSCVYVYHRGELRFPLAALPVKEKAIAIRFSPVVYELEDVRRSPVPLPLAPAESAESDVASAAAGAGAGAGSRLAQRSAGNLGYRCVMAVATTRALYVYETQVRCASR